MAEYSSTSNEDGSSQNDEPFLPKFERGKLSIDLDSVQKDIDKQTIQDIYALQEKIKQTSDRILYRWKNFDVVFPPPITEVNNTSIKSSLSTSQMKDLFNVPKEDELDAVAIDGNGKTKRLNNEQFEQIRKNGEFEVDSINFPGLKHKWRLAKFLQLGYVRANEIFFNTLSKGLYLLIVTAKHRITSNTFSLKASLSAWKNGFYQLIDILIGLPAMEEVPFIDKLLELEQKYMVAELLIDESEQTKYKKFCSDFEIRYKEDKKLSNGNYVNFTKYITPLDAPSFYKTPDGTIIDLRLYDKELMKRLQPILYNIMSFSSDEDKDWFLKERKKLISKYQAEGKSVDEISKLVQNILLEEYIKIAFDRVLSNKRINAVSNGIGKVLMDQAKAYLIMTRAHESVENMIKYHEETYRNSLISKHPVKSNINAWLNEQVDNEMESFKKAHIYTEYEIALKELNDNNLVQSAYFLNRELQFRKQEEPKLIKQFKKIKQPVKDFIFSRKIWLPKNWIVFKFEKDSGSCERVKPVIFKKQFLSRPEHHDSSNIYYTLNKEITYTSSTRYPFWRWKNFFLRTYCYFLNTSFFLVIVVPFFSPVSFKALFSRLPYHPYRDINRETGHIHPTKRPEILTFMSRVGAIWSHVRDSRQTFEAIPDRGLIGKNVQRFFNVIWNFVIKGAGGTLLLTLTFPLACIFVSVFSLLAGILSPIWYPIVSFFHHLGFVLFYDWDSPYSANLVNLSKIMVIFQVFVVKFFIFGLLQPVAALSTTLIACPVASVFIFLFACIHKGCRTIWDNFIFYAILKRQAKIPSRDTFVAKRIAGPGLASDYFCQIRTEQALAALEAYIEKEVINSYVSRVYQIIPLPLEEYRKFHSALGLPFSLSLCEEKHTTYSTLKLETNTRMENYSKAVSKILERLDHFLPKTNASKMRMKENDLKILLSKSTEIVKLHYQKSILKYKKKSEKEFFREYQIDDSDWTCFAGMILEKIFNKNFLTPLEETDNYFHLDVSHLDVSKYTKMIFNSQLRDDLDIVMEKYNPKTSRISVTMPNMTTDIYSSRNRNSYCLSGTIQVPLFLPPLNGIVALLIHNRDNPDNLIKYDTFQHAETLIAP